MKPYRSLPWLEWSFGAAVLLGLLSCSALLLVNQFQQEAAERIAWWNQQIGTDESTTMYQGWIASVEHQQQQAAFVQTLACWGWRCSIAIGVFCWLGVLALHPRRALQMLAFVSLWVRLRWASRTIRRWRREAPQRIGYLHLAVAIVCIGCIMLILHCSTGDTFRLWKIWNFCYYLAVVLFIIKTLLLWIAFRRLKQAEEASIIIVILNVMLISADTVAWPCVAFIVFWLLDDTVMSFG